MRAAMTGLERILAAVRFEPAIGFPSSPQIFGHAARIAGVSARPISD
jgi:hypothetical protein